MGNRLPGLPHPSLTARLASPYVSLRATVAARRGGSAGPAPPQGVAALAGRAAAAGPR